MYLDQNTTEYRELGNTVGVNPYIILSIHIKHDFHSNFVAHVHRRSFGRSSEICRIPRDNDTHEMYV